MSSKGPKALIRPEIQALNAYHVQAADNVIKLDAMENPWPWPGDLMASWQEKLTQVQVNRYPDPGASGVKAGLRVVMNAPEDCHILLGNGSDEIIQIIAMAMAKPGAKLLSVEPAFVMYSMIAKLTGLDYVGVPLQADFSLDLAGMLAAIELHQPAIIFLAQPNNPTGNLFDLASIRQIIERAEGLVVLDEAYTAFTDANMLPLLREYDNVVVMRTLSKVGLAGLRLGMLFGKAEWLDEFDKVRLPYNINSLTQLSAEFALQHYEPLLQQSAAIIKSRASLQEVLRQLSGVEVFPSEANFVLVRVTACSARAVFESMKAQGVLIKCLDGGHPLLQGCLRLTVGTEEENSQMILALKAALQRVEHGR
ncbi:MAG: histidinol-phosphate transaminase [Hahellaceae bacterium]|nr:histidinol-phosphate transaminase [Hahellaceae bacterium]MCP5169052.1 histidinol-phosphate transaminase [Hahellaceae bacterium]